MKETAEKASPQSGIQTSIYRLTGNIRKESDHCHNKKQADAGAMHIGQTDGLDGGSTPCPVLPDSIWMIFKMEL